MLYYVRGVNETMSTCPYCEHPVSTISNQYDCPSCHQAIFNVPCPRCRRRTLNLTQLARYGHITCFACQVVFDQLPAPASPSECIQPATDTPQANHRHGQQSGQMSIRVPTPHSAPVLPNVLTARQMLCECLTRAQQAMQHPSPPLSPEHQAIITRFLAVGQEILTLEAAMTRGEVNAAWLNDDEYRAQLVRCCYTPCWPLDGALLPPVTQGWMVAVDDAIRYWQFARRLWLNEVCGIRMIPMTESLVDTRINWRVEVNG